MYKFHIQLQTTDFICDMILIQKTLVKLSTNKDIGGAGVVGGGIRKVKPHVLAFYYFVETFVCLNNIHFVRKTSTYIPMLEGNKEKLGYCSCDLGSRCYGLFAAVITGNK